jgi:signal transduction histidine kinase
VLRNPRAASGDLIVVRTERDGQQVATMVAPLEVQRARVGFITTTRPAEAAFAAVRGAAYRLALLVLLAMAGIVAIGALLSRTILRQVRPLVATHRALGGGDLSARTPVTGDDELGEVARGLNRMAQQLEASVTALESQVDQRTAEVRRLLAQRTEFFAGLSHEFRTPLAIVLAQAQLMLDNGRRRSDSDRDSLLVVQQSARQALALVNEFLDLSRAEADRLEVTAAPVDLVPIVRDLASTVRGLAGSAEVAVELDLPDHAVEVLGDPRRLRDIALNLSDNAIKYTPPGGRIRLAVCPQPDRVLLEVSDNGLGIPESARGQVYEAFYRVTGNEPQAGQASSGLGLALTKRLVEAHGGTIDFTSSPGSGTTFRVTLPRALEVTGHDPAPGNLDRALDPQLPAR